MNATLATDPPMTNLIAPADEHNIQLVENVHPPDWTNPTPDGRYNLVVIGAGTAGLVTAAGAAGLGAKVALIERHLMGGDCLNVGCVPSKGVISAARVAETVANADEFGVEVEGHHVDFSKVMERMRKLRAGIAHVDSAARFRDLGVDVYLGDAKFTSETTIEVAGQRLTYSKAVIATGAKAFVPPIPGLKEAGYLTNENVFELTELPSRLVIVGGGPIGSELAQTFARFGTDVIQVEKSGHVLANDDAEAAAVVQAAMQRSGVTQLLNSEIERVETAGGQKIVYIKTPEGIREEAVDHVLIGAGRVPNVGLNLEAAGVKYTERHGVEVDDYLRTSNPKIYAAGDVASRFKFTHAADFLARAVIQNALVASVIKVGGWKKASDLVIPWATYTTPELAHVGKTQDQASKEGIETDVYKVEFEHLDRAILDGDTEGFVKIVTKKGTDEIIGGTIVAERAGDMIGEITLAIQKKVGLGTIASVIHPYPTVGEAIRKAGDLYNKTKLTPTAAKAFKWLFAKTR